MNPFRKCARTGFRDTGGTLIRQTEIMETKNVKIDGVETTVVTSKKVDVQKYADKLGMVRTEDYQLKDMLKSGHVPDEVPVSGMLDNPDPTALENVGRDTELFNKLVNMTPESAPEPTPEPTPEPSPSND